MVGAITTELKYPNGFRKFDGVYYKRCGNCGEYYPKKHFIVNLKKSLKRSAYCEDCRKFMEIYNDEKRELSNWVKRRIDEKKKCQ